MSMIYSDDINAVEKLRAKLGKLKTQQDRMKAVNKGWRKAGKPKPDNVEAWQQIADGMGCTLEDLGPTRVDMAHDFLDRAPYSYHITNNGGNMKRIKDRIVRLVREREQGEVEKEPPYAHQDAGIVREDMAAMSEEEVEEAESEAKEAIGKLTPAGARVVHELVKGFYEPTEEEEEAAAANEGEWFPPPNRG